MLDIIVTHPQLFHVCGEGGSPKECTALTQVSNLLVTLNSSVNFVIYCIYGEKFRRLFCDLVCKPCGGREENPTTNRCYTTYTTAQGLSTDKSQVYEANHKTSTSYLNNTLRNETSGAKLKPMLKVSICYSISISI